MSKIFEYFEQIGAAFGPSGREDGVRAIIGAMAGDYCDDMWTDAMGSLICRKKGVGKPAFKKKILLAAHMDSIGVVVTNIDEKGFLRFANVGGLFKGDLINIQVRFENGVRGVISFEEKTPFDKLTLQNLFIDIGAKDREAAKELVQVGDFAVFEAPRFEQGGVICGPYLDNRIGCVILLRTMELLPETVDNDLYFAFTVQEEVGLRGAGPAAFAVEPDFAFAVDVTDTGDLPEHKYPMDCHMGEGPAIKIMDSSSICAPAMVEALEEAAGNLGMKIQHEILQYGGTDTAMLQRSRAGVPSGAVSIPTRYIHSPSEMCAVSDVEDSARLLAETIVNVLHEEEADE